MTRGDSVALLSCFILAFSFAILAQVQSATGDDILDLKKLIHHDKQSNVRPHFITMDTITFLIEEFTDKRFVNDKDRSPQVGYLILYSHKQRIARLIDYSSFKLKRDARSELVAELFALRHAYDVASTVIFALNDMLITKLPLKL